MKKKIISKTITFILIIAFVVLFKTLFGDENVLIGVTIITATLMMMNRDLSLNITRNTVFLIMINVLSGILAYYASMNVTLGIICNFTAMFFIGFLFCYNIKTSLYLPFGLQYVFMLSMPVAQDKILLRLLSLTVGGIIIMIPQLLNKNKSKKVVVNEINSICDNLMKKVDLIISREDIKEIDKAIQKCIGNISNSIYFKRKEYFYITKEGKINLNIYISLNKINLVLDKIQFLENKDAYEEILKRLKEELELIKTSHIDEKSLNKMSDNIDKLIEKYRNSRENDEYILEILSSLNFIRDVFKQKISLNDKELNAIKKVKEIKNEFKLGYKVKVNLRKDSAKFCYAIKVALVVTIAAFITQYFKLEDGRWIIFTVFSLTQPYKEISFKKTTQRIKGTIVGVIIFIVSFGLVTGQTGRMILIMIAGYISSFTEEYDKKMILVTISALGAASITGSTNIVALHRFLYVILGAIIAVLANQFVLPYKVEDSSRHLMKVYFNIIKNMLNEIILSFEGKENNDYMRNLVVISSLVDNKLMSNNEILKNEDIRKIIEEQRNVVGDLYYLFLDIRTKQYSGSLNEDIKFLMEYINSSKDKIEIEEEYINNKFDLEKANNISEKLAIINLKDIFLEIRNLKFQGII